MTEQQKKQIAKKVEETTNGLGVTAEGCVIFLRAAKTAGATEEEAIALVRTYLEAMLADARRAQERGNHGD